MASVMVEGMEFPSGLSALDHEEAGVHAQVRGERKPALRQLQSSLRKESTLMKIDPREPNLFEHCAHIAKVLQVLAPAWVVGVVICTI